MTYIVSGGAINSTHPVVDPFTAPCQVVYFFPVLLLSVKSLAEKTASEMTNWLKRSLTRLLAMIAHCSIYANASMFRDTNTTINNNNKRICKAP